MTGWEALDASVGQLYATTRFLSIDMRFDGASNSLTNYFWVMWTFLGLFWGSIFVLAWSWFLRVLAVPSLVFCWAVWIAFGQAAGGFVGPRAWAVMMLAAAVSIIHERMRERDAYAASLWEQEDFYAPPPRRRPAANTEPNIPLLGEPVRGRS